MKILKNTKKILILTLGLLPFCNYSYGVIEVLEKNDQSKTESEHVLKLTMRNRGNSIVLSWAPVEKGRKILVPAYMVYIGSDSKIANANTNSYTVYLSELKTKTVQFQVKSSDGKITSNIRTFTNELFVEKPQPKKVEKEIEQKPIEEKKIGGMNSNEIKISSNIQENKIVDKNEKIETVEDLIKEKEIDENEIKTSSNTIQENKIVVKDEKIEKNEIKTEGRSTEDEFLQMLMKIKEENIINIVSKFELIEQLDISQKLSNISNALNQIIANSMDKTSKINDDYNIITFGLDVSQETRESLLNKNVLATICDFIKEKATPDFLKMLGYTEELINTIEIIRAMSEKEAKQKNILAIWKQIKESV